jgi:NADPH:quinone reductase-like Zn-dependent oxidoreductase
LKNVSGHFHGTTLPRTPGRDFGGVIVSCDQQGRRVWGTVPGMGVTRDGTHAQYVAVPAAVSPIPENLSFEQAATIDVA